MIQVADGDNSITVASGANMHFDASMLNHEPQRDEVWVAQFETPVAATREILARAREAGARTVLNLAPFVEHPADLLQSVDVAVLNEIELSQATARGSMRRVRRRASPPPAASCATEARAPSLRRWASAAPWS